MKKLPILLFLFVFLIPHLALSQNKASGTVYLDENKNGMMDNAENGIAGVAVSNGRDVVLTDENGRYSIPADNDETIFVIKPAGYRLPVNEQNLPQFYYTHKPNGSSELDFAGVEPTGPLPESINFGLLPGNSNEQFYILVFGDPQPYTIQEVGYFERDIVEELLGAEGYQFGISLGDLVGDDLDLFAPYNKAVARIGLPWFNVYGNHDMNFDAPADSLADETFERVYGPPTYSFNEGDVHFIILDDVFYPRTDDKNGYIGGFTDDQLTFLKNDLMHVPEDHLIVLAFHIPLFEPREWGNTFRDADRQRLFELLKTYPHTLSLSAHTHFQRIAFMDSTESWTRERPHLHYNVGTTSGDWWSGVPDEEGIPPTIMRDGTSNGYASIHFKGNEFVLNYTVAGDNASKKMSIWGPEVVPQDSWHSADLYVNYFLGSDSTKIDYRISGREGEWRAMRKVDEADPHISSLRQKWDTADQLLPGKRPSNPVTSSHLWKTRVPNNLPLGIHKIEIRVIDMFDRTFTDEFTYKVVQPYGVSEDQ